MVMTSMMVMMMMMLMLTPARDVVVELRQRLVELLQKQAKNPNLAQVLLAASVYP